MSKSKYYEELDECNNYISQINKYINEKKISHSHSCNIPLRKKKLSNSELESLGKSSSSNLLLKKKGSSASINITNQHQPKTAINSALQPKITKKPSTSSLFNYSATEIPCKSEQNNKQNFSQTQILHRRNQKQRNVPSNELLKPDERKIKAKINSSFIQDSEDNIARFNGKFDKVSNCNINIEERKCSKCEEEYEGDYELIAYPECHHWMHIKCFAEHVVDQRNQGNNLSCPNCGKPYF